MTPWQNRVTELTRRMADDMKVRSDSQRTIDAYTHHVGKPLPNRNPTTETTSNGSQTT